MIPLTLALMAHMAAADDFAARLETLSFHVTRLREIVVPEDLRTEKDAKLADLEARVAGGVTTEEEFVALYNDIDDIRGWLWDHAVNKPVTAQGGFNDNDQAWSVKTDSLTLAIAKSDLSMTVTTPKTEWRFAPCDDNDVGFVGNTAGLRTAETISVEPFNTGYSVGLMATFSGFPAAPGFELRITAYLVDNEIVFDLAARDSDLTVTAVNWPKPVIVDKSPDVTSVIPYMQGMLLPGDWPQDIRHTDLCNSRPLYMPWWGQIVNGKGVQTILETGDDAGASYSHPAGGPTTIAPRWWPSMGKVRYLRTIRYVFDDNSTYVTMAKRYRRYVRETGRFVSLDEKRVRTPGLNEVIGRPVVHVGALYHFVRTASLFNKDRIENNHALKTFDQLAAGLRGLKASGIDDAYVHLDGWGFYGYDNHHPDVLPVGEEQGGWDGLRRFAATCDELGYWFAVHDQYRDFYLDAASFDDRLAATRIDGGREQHATWCGGPQTILSARFAPGYVRRNHDLFKEHGVDVRGAYLDVFAVVPLEESFQPGQPMTRSDCARYRRECFDLLRTRGYVVSSEEPADYLVRSLDLVHHGPYATYPGLGGGDASGIPVPLFSLVYHDSILLPWETGDDGGWGIPKGDAGWLHCLLNAGLPYVGPGASPELVARVNEAANLAAQCGTIEMTNHEFLDSTRRKQRTTFSDGTTVTVDFDSREYTITTP